MVPSGFSPTGRGLGLACIEGVRFSDELTFKNRESSSKTNQTFFVFVFLPEVKDSEMMAQQLHLEAISWRRFL